MMPFEFAKILMCKKWPEQVCRAVALFFTHKLSNSASPEMDARRADLVMRDSGCCMHAE